VEEEAFENQRYIPLAVRALLLPRFSL
jgi:hypothetical protein